MQNTNIINQQIPPIQIKRDPIKPVQKKPLNVLSTTPQKPTQSHTPIHHIAPTFTPPPSSATPIPSQSQIVNQKKPIQNQKKVSQKAKQTPNSNKKVKSMTNVPTNLNQKVNFNLKNNQVDKFYCPQLAIAKLTKSRPIDLESIPDLPEIPLEKLLGAL
jgi:hypothetical protein